MRWSFWVARDGDNWDQAVWLSDQTKRMSKQQDTGHFLSHQPASLWKDVCWCKSWSTCVSSVNQGGQKAKNIQQIYDLAMWGNTCLETEVSDKSWFQLFGGSCHYGHHAHYNLDKQSKMFMETGQCRSHPTRLEPLSLYNDNSEAKYRFVTLLNT